MRTRFYINEDDSHSGEFNYVITPEEKKIEYSYMCTGEHLPPEGCEYYLAYETDDDNYRIIVDPFGMRGCYDN